MSSGGRAALLAVAVVVVATATGTPASPGTSRTQVGVGGPPITSVNDTAVPENIATTTVGSNGPVPAALAPGLLAVVGRIVSATSSSIATSSALKAPTGWYLPSATAAEE